MARQLYDQGSHQRIRSPRWLAILRNVSLAEWISSLTALLSSVLLCVATSNLTTPYSNALEAVKWKLSASHEPREISCGPDEHGHLGPDCIFDQMLNGWVPKACYNKNLADTALRNDTMLALMSGSGQFPWYSDVDFQNPISPPDLPNHLRSEAANMTAYTLEKWHMAHCLYIWRLGLDMMQRVYDGEKGIYVNVRVLDRDHVQHCNTVIANQDHRVGAKATVTFGYGTCVKVG